MGFGNAQHSLRLSPVEAGEALMNVMVEELGKIKAQK
jgi:hypothetical protein